MAAYGWPGWLLYLGCFSNLVSLSFGAQAQTLAPTNANTLFIASSLNPSTLSNGIEQRLQTAYQQLGYQLKVQHLPAGRSLLMADRGDYDGELFRIGGLSQQYANLCQIAVPLAKIELYAYSLPEQQSQLLDWQNNAQLRVGFVRGFQLAEKLTFSGEKVALTTLQQAVQMLLQHKIDLLLEDQMSLQSFLQAHHAAELVSGSDLTLDRIQPLPQLLSSAELFHYLHARHRRLIEPLTQALQQQNSVVAPGTAVVYYPCKPSMQTGDELTQHHSVAIE